MTRTGASTILFMTLLGLASCSGSPRSLGITGPGSNASGGSPALGIPSLAHGPSVPGSSASMNDDAAIQPPGAPSDFGARYAPSMEPTYGTDGRFYGYN